MVAALLSLFRELTPYRVFRECDVIDLSTEQKFGRAAIRNLAQHSVTFSDVLSPFKLSLAAAWLLWDSGLRESAVALLS